MELHNIRQHLYQNPHGFCKSGDSYLGLGIFVACLQQVQSCFLLFFFFNISIVTVLFIPQLICIFKNVFFENGRRAVL